MVDSYARAYKRMIGAKPTTINETTFPVFNELFPRETFEGVLQYCHTFSVGVTK